MKPARESAIRRSVRMGRMGLEYFVLYRLTRHRRKPLGRRLREACENLGLVFIKIGQILSTRYDLMDRSDCEELQQLLDAVPPIPYEEMERVFVSDFGISPEETFQSFSREPLASASISQVHRATLKEGLEVVVKIRRPGIGKTIASDLKVFRSLARIAWFFSPTLRRFDALEVLRQLEEWLWLEVDFEHERENIIAARQFYKQKENLAGEYADAIVFPEVYPHLCSPRVITMEFLEGVPAKRFKEIEGDPDYDPRASLESLVRAVLRVWMTGDALMFHGDPHPSNVLLMKGGKIGLIDLGLLSSFNAKDLQQTRDLFLAVYSKDTDLSIRYMLEMSDVSYEKYAPLIREDVKHYLVNTRVSGMGFWFLGVCKIFVKHRVSVPNQLILFGRMQILIDGLFETVLPGVTTLDILGEELESALRRKVLKNLTQINFAAAAYVLTEKFKKSPEALAEFLDRYLDHPLDLVAEISRAVQGTSPERV